MTKEDKIKFNHYIIDLWRKAMDTEDIDSARIFGAYLATEGFTRMSIDKILTTNDVQF